MSGRGAIARTPADVPSPTRPYQVSTLCALRESPDGGRSDGARCGGRRGGAEQMIAELKTVGLDAPRIAAEADFYAALAGWTRSYADDEWITMRTPDGWRIAF